MKAEDTLKSTTEDPLSVDNKNRCACLYSTQRPR